jgi:hypothetical protein
MLIQLNFWANSGNLTRSALHASSKLLRVKEPFQEFDFAIQFLSNVLCFWLGVRRRVTAFPHRSEKIFS